MLAAEPPEPSVMDKPPRRPGKRLLVSGPDPELCQSYIVILSMSFICKYLRLNNSFDHQATQKAWQEAAGECA
jgi:hypothetical protein